MIWQRLCSLFSFTSLLHLTSSSSLRHGFKGSLFLSYWLLKGLKYSTRALQKHYLQESSKLCYKIKTPWALTYIEGQSKQMKWMRGFKTVLWNLRGWTTDRTKKDSALFSLLRQNVSENRMFSEFKTSLSDIFRIIYHLLLNYFFFMDSDRIFTHLFKGHAVFIPCLGKQPGWWCEWKVWSKYSHQVKYSENDLVGY